MESRNVSTLALQPFVHIDVAAGKPSKKILVAKCENEMCNEL
jgi:hypothetical protein